MWMFYQKVLCEIFVVREENSIIEWRSERIEIIKMTMSNDNDDSDDHDVKW
jgi:hypothetical protein